MFRCALHRQHAVRGWRSILDATCADTSTPIAPNVKSAVVDGTVRLNPSLSVCVRNPLDRLRSLPQLLHAMTTTNLIALFGTVQHH